VPQPGANHINIADAVYERMEQMKKDLPDDVHYSYGFDNTKFIRASINEVKQTVYEAFVLEPTKETGITIQGTNVTRQSRKNRKMMIITRTKASAGHESEEGRNRRRQGNLFCRHFHDGHPGSRVLPYRIYGRYDRTAFPRVQYGHFRSGSHIIVRGTDIHPHVGY